MGLCKILVKPKNIFSLFFSFLYGSHPLVKSLNNQQLTKQSNMLICSSYINYYYG